VGGGAPAAPTGPALAGRVVAEAEPGAGEVGIAGAVVRTSDGRSATAGPDGRFALIGGAPDDGVYTASAPGFITSTVVGLVAGDAPVLHVQSTDAVSAQPLPAASWTIRGVIHDPSGQPRPGAVVVLQDEHGATSAPAETNDAGEYALTIFSPDQRVQDGTLIAYYDGPPGVRAMAMATGLSLDPSDTRLDIDPAMLGETPLRLILATHPIRVRLDSDAVGASPVVAVSLEGPGARLTLPMADDTAWVAPVPGARYALRAEARQPDMGTWSLLVRDSIAIDFAAAETTVTEPMLAPPHPTLIPELGPVDALAWGGVPEATGFKVELAGLDGQGLWWEAFTTETRLLTPGWEALPGGRYGLTITAIEAPGLTARHVAQAGARQLRRLPLPETYRQSARQLRLTR
jgi:hypothetical protein